MRNNCIKIPLVQSELTIYATSYAQIYFKSSQWK